MVGGNEQQRETIDMLQSELENMEVADETEAGALVFTGDGEDGPEMGYIELDGKVTWVVGG